MIRASLNLCARVAMSSIYFCEKYSIYCSYFGGALKDRGFISLYHCLPDSYTTGTLVAGCFNHLVL